MEPLSRDEVGATLEPITEDLQLVEKLLEEESKAPGGFLSDAATHLVKAGGKRLRPALVVLASMLGTGPNREVHLTAAAVEMTHIATLYHDDVIDEADLRRGVPSVNEKWGNTVAILAGDYLFARSSDLAAKVGGDVPHILAGAIARVVQGQVAELEATYDASRTADHYFETIKMKTAALLEAAVKVGGILAGCPDSLVASLEDFGTNFGLAFQVADDLLDLVSTREDLGKPPGTDVKDGVYTLPVILAMQEDTSLADALGRNPDFAAVLRAVRRTGALDRSLGLAREFASKALASLDSAPQGLARDRLEKLTRLIVERVPR